MVTAVNVTERCRMHISEQFINAICQLKTDKNFNKGGKSKCAMKCHKYATIIFRQTFAYHSVPPCSVIFQEFNYGFLQLSLLLYTDILYSIICNILPQHCFSFITFCFEIWPSRDPDDDTNFSKRHLPKLFLRKCFNTIYVFICFLDLNPPQVKSFTRFQSKNQFIYCSSGIKNGTTSYYVNLKCLDPANCGSVSKKMSSQMHFEPQTHSLIERRILLSRNCDGNPWKNP